MEGRERWRERGVGKDNAGGRGEVRKGGKEVVNFSKFMD